MATNGPNFEIKVTIDESATQARLQAQLDKIAKKIKFNIAGNITGASAGKNTGGGNGSSGSGIASTSVQTKAMQKYVSEINNAYHAFKIGEKGIEAYNKQLGKLISYKNNYKQLSDKSQEAMHKEYVASVDGMTKAATEQFKIDKAISTQKEQLSEAVEKKSQQEYIRSNSAKINMLKVRKKQEEKLDENLEKRSQKEYVRSNTAKINMLKVRKQQEGQLEENLEKRSQQEYIRSNTAKINMMKVRKKQEEQLEENIEKKSQQEYVRSNMAKINLVKVRKKQEEQLEEELEKKSQQEYVRSNTAKINMMKIRKKQEEQASINAEKNEQTRLNKMQEAQSKLNTTRTTTPDIWKNTNVQTLGNNLLGAAQAFDPKNLDTVRNYKKAFIEYADGVKVAGKALAGANTEGKGFFKTLAADAVKAMQWSIVMGAIYGSLRLFKQGVTYVMELDNALNEIRIVTGMTQEEVEVLGTSYGKLAEAMSVSTREIAKEAAELYRQGLSGEEVIERMKSIIMYAKISGIAISESNKIITATANATGESVSKITDIFAYLGDKTASG